MKRVRDVSIRPTLIERINGALPIPYAASCLIVAALLGPVGFLIADFLSAYPDFAKASGTFFQNTQRFTLSQRVGNDVIYPAITFYCAFMLRYIRRRIVRVEDELIKESPEWSGTIKRSFRGISRTGPALAITFALLFFTLPFVVLQVSKNQGIAQLYFLIAFSLFCFISGSFIWMYTSSLWGLYKLGTGPVKLRPYTVDPLLGLGGLGRISLTLTVVFLIAVFFATYQLSLYTVVIPLLSTIFFSALLVGLGVSMFFLPLYNAHRRMIHERARLRSRALTALHESVSAGKTDGTVSGAEGLRRVLILEHDTEQINAIHSWPFEAPVIRSLAAIVFSITVSITAHLIIVFLGI